MKKSRAAQVAATLLVGALLGLLAWVFLTSRDSLNSFSTRVLTRGPLSALASEQTVVLIPLAVSLATLLFRGWWARSAAWRSFRFWVAAPLGGLTLAAIGGGLFGGLLTLSTLAQAFTEAPLPTVRDVLMTLLGALFFSGFGVFFGLFQGALSLAFLPIGALLVLWMRYLDARRAA